MPQPVKGRLPLRARDGSVRDYALVDATDFDWLNQWRWSLGSHGYAWRNTRLDNRKGRAILLHRAILGLEHGDPRFGEHRDRNPLNCRRSNLRIAERGHADNQQNRGLDASNTSGYRGVCWHKQRRKWLAYVMLAGRQHSLGLHDTAERADAVARALRAESMPFSEDAALAVAA